MTAPLLVRAARGEPVERTPVWFMRQAGRSLPEYRDVRARHSFWEVANEPELCAQVTLQPVARHGVDAAVIFADIMTPVVAMGVDVQLVEGVGPVVDQQWTDLRVPDVVAPQLAEAIRIVRSELSEDKAVIGFCGGPFTVASYLFKRDFDAMKALLYSSPQEWHALMETLTRCFERYIAEQVAAGADVIQLFDSWMGVLSPEDFEQIAPYNNRLLASVDVPTIHFGTANAHLHDQLGGDVLGLDWRVSIDVAPDRVVQGNLDPAALLGPWEAVEERVLAILERARNAAGHIFNLGHGVLPQTDPAVVTKLAELVQTRTVEARV